MALTVTIAPLNGKIGLNKSQKFTATPSGAVADSTFAYKWFVNGVVQTGNEDAMFDYVGTSLGEKTIKVNVISHDKGLVETETAEASTKLTVEEPFGPEVDAVYVHPLPHRNSAYIWSGWWVMDEIDRLTNLGIDWKTAPSDSKYSLHLKVLAKMIVDYPEVDVQESRNGRIVHRSALEVGIIY